MKIDEEIRIKMADEDNWTGVHSHGGELWGNYKGVLGFDNLPALSIVPTYDNDNDLDRFVREMDKTTLEVYDHFLRAETGEFRVDSLQATVEQKLAAILRAKGWDK